jgi:hypothetical protein
MIPTLQIHGHFDPRTACTLDLQAMATRRYVR